MKEGTKVKVIACYIGHQFDIGEVVERRVGEYDDSRSLGFYSETHNFWYMREDEYQILNTRDHALELLVEAMNACHSAGFSRGVWEVVSEAVNQAYKEIEE